VLRDMGWGVEALRRDFWACGRRTTISLRSPSTARKKEATTAPKMAAVAGMAALMDPHPSSSACVIQLAPDLPTCARGAACRDWLGQAGAEPRRP
jgi:hypothetical protein